MSRLEERKDAPRIFDPNIDRTPRIEEAEKTTLTERIVALVKSAADLILWPSATPLKIERPSGEGWNAGNSRWN